MEHFMKSVFRRRENWIQVPATALVIGLSTLASNQWLHQKLFYLWQCLWPRKKDYICTLKSTKTDTRKRAKNWTASSPDPSHRSDCLKSIWRQISVSTQVLSFWQWWIKIFDPSSLERAVFLYYSPTTHAAFLSNTIQLLFPRTNIHISAAI